MAYIAALAIALGAFFRQFSIRNIGITTDARTLLSGITLLSASLVILSIYLFFYDLKPVFEMFKTPWPYVAIITEIALYNVAIQNYSVNRNNIGAIEVSTFIQIPLVIVLSYYATKWMGWENSTITVNYKSVSEMWAVFGIVSVLIFFYFKTLNLKPSKNMFLLILQPVIMSITLFSTGKMMQIHGSLTAYLAIYTPLSLFQILLGTLGGEWKSISNKTLIQAAKIVPSTLTTHGANMFGVQYVAVEAFAIIKRGGGVITGYIYDKILDRNRMVSSREILAVLTIFLVIILITRSS